MLQCRAPPGLEGLGRSSRSASSSPSPHTPLPPAVWGGDESWDIHSVSTGVKTPPRIDQAEPQSSRQKASLTSAVAPKPPGLSLNSLLSGPIEQASLDLVGSQLPIAPAAQQLTLPLSIGSVGHPHKCAGSCKYVKRKGGCRDGAQCTSCHLCFWRRDSCNAGEEGTKQLREGALASATRAAKNDIATSSLSIGTRGHPHSCAGACRYIRRKTGCRDGAACPNCHACIWRRTAAPDAQDADNKSDSLQKDADNIQPTAASTIEDGTKVFDSDATNNLQDLISLLIQRKQGVPEDTLCMPC